MASALKESMLKKLGVPDPWQQEYEDRDFVDQGWFTETARTTLDGLCKQIRPSIIIEVGAWLGKSTRFFADRCDLVIAVDHWLGTEADRSRQGKQFPTLFDQFLSNCASRQDKILPLRMTSNEAARLPLPQAGLIYIDADHAEAAVAADIANYFGFLAAGGLMCGDDYVPTSGRGQAIARSVHAFASEQQVTVGVRVPLWWYVPRATGRRGEATLGAD